jgi:hypothetical protein
LRSNDIAATRLTLEVDDVSTLEHRLAAAHVRSWRLGMGPALLIRDLDGHALLHLGH